MVFVKRSGNSFQLKSWQAADAIGSGGGKGREEFVWITCCGSESKGKRRRKQRDATKHNAICGGSHGLPSVDLLCLWPLKRPSTYYKLEESCSALNLLIQPPLHLPPQKLVPWMVRGKN